MLNTSSGLSYVDDETGGSSTLVVVVSLVLVESVDCGEPGNC